MPKLEKLTNEHIIQDCLAIERSYLRDPVVYRCKIIGVLTLIGAVLLLGHFKVLIWFDMAIMAYHLVMLIRRIITITSRCKRIQNGDFSVSTDELKYVNEEMIAEPHRRSLIREITKLHFTSLSHRVAYTTYYTWSEGAVRADGLINTSRVGDEFYLILDNQTHDVLCVYNQKYFEYDQNT